MDKKLFRSIPILEATREQKEFAIQLGHTSIKYFIVAEKLKRNTIILNVFCNSALDKVAYRLFINKNDYITQDFTTGNMKWKTGSFDRILGEDYYFSSSRWHETGVLVDSNSINTLREFFVLKEEQQTNYLKDIYNLQYEIKDRRLRLKHQEIKDRIDEEMKKVLALPNNFKRWIDKTGLYNSRYIYYEYKARKVLDGYCTNCKKDVRVEGARHNKKGICPNCRSPITFKATGKSRNIIDKGQIALLQRYKDDLIVRCFTVSKDYSRDYRNPTLHYAELVRHFITDNMKQTQYEMGNFKQTGEIRWRDSLYFFEFYDTVLFTRNLDQVLKGTKWEYSAIKEYATQEKGFGFPVFNYLIAYYKVPMLEYLVKLKLYNLASSTLYFQYKYKDTINVNGTNILEVLRIQKEQLQIVKRMNPTIDELNVIQELAKYDIHLEDKNIRFIAENLRIDNVIEMFKYTTYYKMIKYINSQYKGGKNLQYILSDWVDYVFDCKLLNYSLENTLVLFPRDLDKAHREIRSMVENRKVELFNEKFNELYETYINTFGWTFKNYVIEPPKSYDEVIEEGNVLDHCVGSQIYGDKVIKGESVILFLRKKEEIEKPFYTLEVDAKTLELIQCRGKRNKSMNDEVKAIVDKYSEKKLHKELKKVA